MSEGNIIVDGVLASCYADVDHDLAHFGMTLIRLFPKIIKWIFGDDTIIPAFVDTAKGLSSLMLPNGQLRNYQFN